MTTTNDSSLAETMAEVARLLQAENDLDTMWTRITELAVERLHGVEHAGVTVVARGVPSSAAASDDLPPAVDAIQGDCSEGPCLDAVTEQDTFSTGNLSAGTERWPRFGPCAFEEPGVQSVVSSRMIVQDDLLGAPTPPPHRRAGVRRPEDLQPEHQPHTARRRRRRRPHRRSARRSASNAPPSVP